MFGFFSKAHRRKLCSARCPSIWYLLFIATLSFSWQKMTPRLIIAGGESRYFLRFNGHPPIVAALEQREVRLHGVSGYFGAAFHAHIFFLVMLHGMMRGKFPPHFNVN